MMSIISAIVNTRNEEKNLDSCLSCLKWCDEIVVVDMESEDRTVEIAREYTDKVFTHKKILAFDLARKYAVEQASGDWVFLVDADEIIPSTLMKKIFEIVLEDLVDIIYCPRKNYIMGEWIKNTGFWPDYQPRIFRKNSIRFTEQVHNFMHISDDSKIRYLDVCPEFAIEHFAYNDSDNFVTKLNRYTTIEAKQMFNKGKNFSLFKMLVAGFRGFQVRYISQKGYKDGYRGFFLSLMMGFYRTLNYIKLWEYWQNKDESVEIKYLKIKDKIINEYSE